MGLQQWIHQLQAQSGVGMVSSILCCSPLELQLTTWDLHWLAANYI